MYTSWKPHNSGTLMVCTLSMNKIHKEIVWVCLGQAQLKRNFRNRFDGISALQLEGPDFARSVVILQICTIRMLTLGFRHCSYIITMFYKVHTVCLVENGWFRCQQILQNKAWRTIQHLLHLAKVDRFTKRTVKFNSQKVVLQKIRFPQLNSKNVCYKVTWTSFLGCPGLSTNRYFEWCHSILVRLMSISICVHEAPDHINMAIQGRSP